MTSAKSGASAVSGAVTHDSTSEVLADGSRVYIRPVTRLDVEHERQFIAGLSPESRRFRFLDTLGEPSESLLRQLTTIDPSREAALAATEPLTRRFLAVARYSGVENGSAEIAIAVSDSWQRRGLGTLLARRLIAIARQHGIRRLFSVDSNNNHAMQALAHKLGFHHRINPDDATQVIYTLDLSPGGKSAPPS